MEEPKEQIELLPITVEKKDDKPRAPTQEEIDRAINKLFGVSGAVCMN